VSGCVDGFEGVATCSGLCVVDEVDIKIPVIASVSSLTEEVAVPVWTGARGLLVFSRRSNVTVRILLNPSSSPDLRNHS